jgi:hypothetical protein
MFMKKTLILISGCMIMLACNNQQKSDSDAKVAEATSDSSTAKTQPPAEFADAKYVEMGKATLGAFEKGDVDAWLKDFADNAVFQWSAGDSLAGKPAISNYWKNRRANVIDSIKFSNDIWLPIKINKSQVEGADRPGTWLLSWYQVNVKYKNGKKLQFWVHNDYHFDASDKIDRAIQYIDRAPINAAMAAKK